MTGQKGIFLEVLEAEGEAGVMGHNVLGCGRRVRGHRRNLRWDAGRKRRCFRSLHPNSSCCSRDAGRRGQL